MTGSKGKGSIRERQVEMGAEECSFFFFFREQSEKNSQLLDKGGGVLEAPAVTSENNGAALCGQTTIPRSHFPSLPLINTSRVPVSGEQSGGNMRDETRACIRVFVCKMMSPTSISRCVVLGR